MSLALFVSPKWSFQDDNGGNASGWMLYTYEPGTSTPKAAYQDSAGTTPHANPIVLNARGEAEIWLDGAYKFILKNAAGVTKWTADDITGYGSGVQTGYLTKSVAGSANVALTASEQSNAVIEFTGELTGNINVTVGDDRGGYRWTLINSTTGSFTLTLKTTSGTGAVIDQGAEAVVYHDGTNIVELLTVTAAGKALMDDATADDQLSTLGGTTVGKAVFTAADESAAQSALGLGSAATRDAAGAGDVYARGGILGTVSQSSGVPTGAIIERGSNANGEYVKFADGTMIVTGSASASLAITNAAGSVYRTGPVSVTWAAEFIAAPIVKFQHVVNSGAIWDGTIGAAGAPSTTGGNFVVFSAESITRTVDTSWCAVGRWF